MNTADVSSVSISTLTQLGRTLNMMAARHPHAISAEKVLTAIRHGTIFDRLQDILGGELDLTELERTGLLDTWASYRNAYGRLDDVTDGLPLLLAYVLLEMQHRHSPHTLRQALAGWWARQ